MRREWNAFDRLRQALVHIQTTNALGRRPRPSSTHTQPFRPVREMEVSMWRASAHIVQEFDSLAVLLEHSAQKNANLKHKVSPGADHYSEPQTIGRLGGNTSGDDCAPHRARKDTKSSGSPCLSTANMFIPCGLAISSCGLPSISAITVIRATALDKSCK